MGGPFPGCQLNLTKKKKTSRGEQQQPENWFPVHANKRGFDPDACFFSLMIVLISFFPDSFKEHQRFLVSDVKGVQLVAVSPH